MGFPIEKYSRIQNAISVVLSFKKPALGAPQREAAGSAPRKG